MDFVSRNKIVLALIVAALASCLLPWARFNIFGGTVYAHGYNAWQGKIIIGICVALGLWLMIRKPTPGEQAACMMAAGAVIAIFAGQFILQFVYPAPTKIEVHAGGDFGQAFGEGIAKQVSSQLSFGAPLTLLLGICLLAVGVRQWRGTNATPSAPQLP